MGRRVKFNPVAIEEVTHGCGKPFGIQEVLQCS